MKRTTKALKDIVSFLTIIPVGMDMECLTNAANYMYLFPLVGALIGLLTGLFAWFLTHVLPDSIVGILTLGMLLLITGVHHADGLLDFGDGIMVQGQPLKKIKIMHDQRTGAGGIAIGLVTMLTTALCIGGLDKGVIVQSLIVSEISAKLSMVIVTWIGESAHEGMNTLFVNAMHGEHRKLRLITALIISFGLSALLLPVTGFFIIIAGLVTALIMVSVSRRHFNGVTGDVMGATNELSRMVSLVLILSVIKWA